MPTQVAPKVLAWGAELIEHNCIEQAREIAAMPFVPSHVSLMPDAHAGRGSAVGTVIPTKGAIIPAAIGVDIGCGMAAVKFNIRDEDLPSLDGLMPMIEKAIPAGVGKGHETGNYVDVEKKIGFPKGAGELRHGKRGAKIYTDLQNTAVFQCGSLGSGNHFFEVSLDQDGNVWIVLHSGSRGIGNKLANIHIKVAEELMKKFFIPVKNKDLSYLSEGTDEFDAYIADMLWAQRYAALNREVMLDSAIATFRTFLIQATKGVALQLQEVERINCHHNFTTQENHMGQNLWITRKGAICAREGVRGIIPGSMGTETYIITGKGNTPSYESCSHGAGRPFSRGHAKEVVSEADLREAMAGKVWNEKAAVSLRDESPQAYKDISKVMAAQEDLVTVDAVLTQVFNYKGL
jgi:tRNA-splicing ligase RtcB